MNKFRVTERQTPSEFLPGDRIEVCTPVCGATVSGSVKKEESVQLWMGTGTPTSQHFGKADLTHLIHALAHLRDNL